jgi:hypothetical protein
MKKFLALAAFAGMISLIACGPSEEELKAKEQKRQDSIRMSDSLKAVEEANRQQAIADSLAAIEDANRQKAMADSTRIADSLAKLGKKKPTTKPAPKEEKAPETPKVGSKKPGAK